MSDSVFWDTPRGLRAVPWDELIFESPESIQPCCALRRRREEFGGRGLRHAVPRNLRHIRCMWLEAGDETRRCRRQVAWVMGDPFGRARVYCEEHGGQIRRVAEHRRGDRIARTTSMSS